MAATVTGAIRIGEANGAAFRSAMRATGASWLITLGFLAALAGVGALFEILPTVLNLPDYVQSAGSVAALLLLWAVVIPGYLWFAQRSAAKRLRARGLVDPIPCAVTADEAAFTYAIGDVTNTVRWGGVTDLFRVGRFWVVVVQGGRCFVPCRFFDSRGEERAWVAEMLNHMGAAAQARAKQAVRFVARG